MANSPSQYFQFTGSEILSDVIEMMPEASEILFNHGLGCVDCQFNAFETLQEGFLGHGFSENEFIMLLSDLNEAAQDLNISPNNMPPK